MREIFGGKSGTRPARIEGSSRKDIGGSDETLMYRQILGLYPLS